jgi:four helix bundle protein
MSLEGLKVYSSSMKLGEDVWNIVRGWDYFQKDTIGKQLIRAVDSVAANISEDYGRYHFKDSKNFYYYSRGSLFETKTWVSKAYQRSLLTQEQYDFLSADIETIGKMLNGYIRSIGQVNEPPMEYNNTNDPKTDI